MTAESLAKGLELQKRIAAAHAVIETIELPTTALLYCPEEKHYENATTIPRELAECARASLVATLKALVEELRLEFKAL